MRPHPPSSWVRVAVIEGVQEATLSIKGPFQVVTLETGEVLNEGHSLKNVPVRPAPAGLRVGDTSYRFNALRILADKTKGVVVNGRSYRGHLEIFREKDETLTVVNRVGIEEYIYGVLRHEIAPWWPDEAIKAQAVAVRTYAAYQRSIREKEDYDVTGDVMSQVYGGAKGETWKIRRASQATWGEVLKWKGGLLPAYYSSTCGGHTEAATEVWGDQQAPLVGRDCEFCTVSKHYSWRREIAADLVQKKLRWRGLDIGPIEELKILERTVSGRVKSVQVVHGRGKTVLKGHEFRMHVGPDLVRSTLFNVYREGDHFVLSGRGWGHGVGMCQWGAYTQARRGTRYSDILSFYYPGAAIELLEPKPQPN
ncbi:MAG: SpoIID/LytB domain-containing protein [Candidatus Omnitrophica bacterium]|nr:SpoIID/LytB domain-containing protein [Candidatus Omnitrophota bacterium]